MSLQSHTFGRCLLFVETTSGRVNLLRKREKDTEKENDQEWTRAHLSKVGE